MLTLNGEPYPQKPPLSFWMIAASLHFFGGEVTSWAARLPSILAGILTTLLVFDIGRALWSARTGLLAGLLLLSVPLFALQTPTARVEVPLTAAIVLAAWAWLTAPSHQREARLSLGRTIAFWAGLAAAFFINGPLAPIAMAGMLLGESWRTRSWRPWRSVHPLPGMMVLAVLIGGWLAGQAELGSRGFPPGIAAGEDPGGPAWVYIRTLLGEGFQPWIVFLIPALVFLWRRRAEGVPAGIAPLLFWAGSHLIVLHFSPRKHSADLLPALPALALVTAWFIGELFLVRPLSKGTKTLFSGVGLALVLATIATGVVFEVREDQFHAEQFVVDNMQHVFLGITVLVMLAAFVSFLLQRTPWRAVVMLAVLMLCLEVVYASVINTARSSRRSSRSFASVVSALTKPGEDDVGALGDAGRPEYHIYGDYRIREVELTVESTAPGNALPRLLVADDDRRNLEAIRECGRYEQIFTMPAMGDQLHLFRKAESRRGRPADENGGVMRFAVAGDTGVGDEYDQRRLLEQMIKAHEEKPFDGFFLLGDNLYGEEPFPIAMSTRFIIPFSRFLEDGVPFFASLGNHDNDHEDRIEAELNSPLFNMNGRDHYTQTFGDNLMTLFVLNSVKLEDEEWEQIDWFARELERSEAQWKVLIMHHPIVASSTGHRAEIHIFEKLAPLLPGSDGNGIDIVFAGHNHFFERRAPVDGVWHITLGAGGKLEDDEPFPPDPNQIAGYMDGLSYGYIDVDEEKIRFTAINEYGDVLDEFEIPARGPEDERVLARPDSIAYPLPVE